MNKYEKLINSLRCDGDGVEEDTGGLGCANKKCKYRDVDSACDIVSMTADAADAIESLTAQFAALQVENAEKDREIERLTAERDAAVSDISHVCAERAQHEDNPSLSFEELRGLDVSVSLYFRIRNSSWFGGAGSVGYTALKLDHVYNMDAFSAALIEQKHTETAQLCGVSADEVDVISWEEYKQEAADGDER